jgi:hypothetical protein
MNIIPTTKAKMTIVALNEAVAKQWRKDWPGVNVVARQPLLIGDPLHRVGEPGGLKR